MTRRRERERREASELLLLLLPERRKEEKSRNKKERKRGGRYKIGCTWKGREKLPNVGKGGPAGGICTPFIPFCVRFLGFIFP